MRLPPIRHWKKRNNSCVSLESRPTDGLSGNCLQPFCSSPPVLKYSNMTNTTFFIKWGRGSFYTIDQRFFPSSSKMIKNLIMNIPTVLLPPTVTQNVFSFRLRICTHKVGHHKESSTIIVDLSLSVSARKVTDNVALLTRDHCLSIVVGFKCDQMTSGSVRRGANWNLYLPYLQLSFVGCWLPSVGFELLVVYLSVFVSCQVSAVDGPVSLLVVINLTQFDVGCWLMALSLTSSIRCPSCQQYSFENDKMSVVW